EKTEYNKEVQKTPEYSLNVLEAILPEDVQKKLKAVKEKLDKFKKQILDKFDKYISGIALLPPPRELPKDADAEKEKDKLHVLVLVDDSDSKKMPKEELRQKLTGIVESTAKEIDPLITPQILLLSELWMNCYDAKYDILQVIAMGAPIHDNGMLSAVKIAEVHKTMVLKKFEKYIVAYVLAGSLVQGRATKQSDIDVFIVIDDTDVKKMTRGELKEKLRAIIIGMGIEAGQMTGIQNKLNVQVYILTDFWDSMREANPVIFTFLRDGVPFYDRGIFMPWKQLLKMGKIKPSTEAIDMYISSGEQTLERVKFKLRDIGTEDFFWSTFTPSQAALMLYGIPPPTPKETPEVMRDIFVKKEKLLEEKDIAVLEKILKVRKDIEHGDKKEVTGKEVDDLVESADKYLKRLKRLFTQIEKKKEEETILSTYDTIVSVIRDFLKLEGVEKVSDTELIEKFEDELISKGRVPAKFLRSLHTITKAKRDFEAGKLGRADVESARKESHELLKFLVEEMQRKRAREFERIRIRVRYHEKKFGEVTLLGETAFVIKDLDAENKELLKGKINTDGSIGALEPSSYEELEKSVVKIAVPPKTFIREAVFESLKKIFAPDVEIMMA
ncbi:nucleotidyltransferase domain-containing protein, partial [Candidatus Woesearchaeota archaeon]|nr:nucleotidyltransferase domain-containing protein [Candidatus Woesearchaeota archaeon]